MIVDLSTKTHDFIEHLAKNKKRIVTKINTQLIITKHAGNGDYLSERKVMVPAATVFTVKDYEGSSLFVVPSKSLQHNLIILEGEIKKAKNEEITFQGYRMTPKQFEEHFLIIE